MHACARGGGNACQLLMQDSDGEKSDDNLVVDVSNEVRFMACSASCSYHCNND